jgi:hypothetical protein
MKRLAAQRARAGRGVGRHEAAGLVAERPSPAAARDGEPDDVFGEEPARGGVGVDDVALAIEYKDGVWSYVECGL